MGREVGQGVTHFHCTPRVEFALKRLGELRLGEGVAQANRHVVLLVLEKGVGPCQFQEVGDRFQFQPPGHGRPAVEQVARACAAAGGEVGPQEVLVVAVEQGGLAAEGWGADPGPQFHVHAELGLGVG